jgi:hypothetical protein
LLSQGAIIGAVASLGLVLGGALLLRWMWVLCWLRVRVGEDGFTLVEKRATRKIGWREIISVRETHKYRRTRNGSYIETVNGGYMKDISYLVTIKNGAPFKFGANEIKGHTKLASMIKAETDRRNIPWEIVED